ncbi:YDG/SRA domain-containing protein [Hymenobacter sp. ZK17L-C2]|uniref:YDG/SRA domain-containing protein n=1 Tax=Hymenobacter endophyticus TaxID=3076335 RepID=A0ABU3TKJ4_9BACT|nr:YDG/SRA domain-containing protein [Hymenobacter endophyticus]
MPSPNPVYLGAVPAIRPGHEFLNRHEVQAAGIHRDRMKGISSIAGFPAEAIVLSGGYEDDWDAGGTILYTGEGGNSQGTQVADQTLTGGNLALHRSFEQQTPVRVIRQIRPAKARSSWYYEYAGLYSVARCSYERGRSGFMIWRFLLEQLPEQVLPAPAAFQVQEPAAVYRPAPRITTSVNRLVRDTSLMLRVKRLYDFHCQVCLERLANHARPYAEAAHLQPLGAPHHGPDTLDNLLCLCPNHHVLLDMGTWSLDDQFNLQGLPGALQVHPDHRLKVEWARYHRRHIYQAP